MQSHGYVLEEKSIVSLQLLQDELIRAGGVLKFPCTIELINSVKNSRVKYFADMELQKLTVEKEKQQKMLRVESQEINESNKKKLAEGESEIQRLRSNLQIADAIVQYVKGMSSCTNFYVQSVKILK